MPLDFYDIETGTFCHTNTTRARTDIIFVYIIYNVATGMAVPNCTTLITYGQFRNEFHNLFLDTCHRGGQPVSPGTLL